MLTDNEIIKALECCCSPKVNACDDCPFYERCYENNEWLKKEAIDLINRQKAEIERLKKGWKADVIETSNIKAEAVKEFASELKEQFEHLMYVTGDEVKGRIDNLEKEKVGEADV